MVYEYSICLYRRGIFKIGNTIFKKKKKVKQVLRHVHSINNERIKIKVKRVNLYGQGSPWNREKHRRMLSLRRRRDHRI